MKYNWGKQVRHQIQGAYKLGTLRTLLYNADYVNKLLVEVFEVNVKFLD